MQHQWPPERPPEKTKSEEAAEADVAVADPRQYMLRSWQHSELRPIVPHTVGLEEADCIADLPGHVIFGGP